MVFLAGLFTFVRPRSFSLSYLAVRLAAAALLAHVPTHMQRHRWCRADSVRAHRCVRAVRLQCCNARSDARTSGVMMLAFNQHAGAKIMGAALLGLMSWGLCFGGTLVTRSSCSAAPLLAATDQGRAQISVARQTSHYTAAHAAVSPSSSCSSFPCAFTTRWPASLARFSWVSL